MNRKGLPGDLESVVLTLCEDIATPLSLSVAILIRYREWDQIAVKRIDPANYVDAERFAADYAVVSLLCKLEDLPTTFDKKKVALDGFFDAERACYWTNERLSPWVHTPSSLWEPGVAADVLSTARKMIASVLGRPPSLLEGRFGPGSTFGDKGLLTTVADKMSSRPTLTSSAIPFLFQWTGTAWATACANGGRELSFVPGNRFTTVPKDCTKFRGIAIEPSINLFYQLALGLVVRRQLKRSGLDLIVGQDIHKRVAREASIRGHLATIDLSSASDTICYNLVKLLLPRDWFDLFDMLRSPKTLVQGKWIKLEKFSSMGNGYTFELETLIFNSLARAAVLHSGGNPINGVNVFTFGDDIIVPTEHARGVIAVLRYFGMSLNTKKTFVTGPFRESCGGDYFDGVNVRPHFLKESPHEPQHFIALANGIRRMAFNDHTPDSRFDHLRRTWFRILDALPSHIRRLRGPQDLGDLVIHDSEEKWQTRQRSCIRYIRTYRPARYRVVGWEHFRPDVVLACAVYGTGDGAVGPTGRRSKPLGITPRDSVLGYKVGWVPYS